MKSSKSFFFLLQVVALFTLGSLSLLEASVTNAAQIGVPDPPPPPPPPPPKPPKPIVDITLLGPWVLVIPGDPDLIQIERPCKLCGPNARVFLGADIEYDPENSVKDLRIGVGVIMRFPPPRRQLENAFEKPAALSEFTVPFTLGSLDGSTSVSGLLTFEDHKFLNPLPELYTFDGDGDGIYNFQNASIFDQFLVDSVKCPEPSSVVGSLLAATSILKFRSKRKKLIAK
jgi:hypothetical protein